MDTWNVPSLALWCKNIYLLRDIWKEWFIFQSLFNLRCFLYKVWAIFDDLFRYEIFTVANVNVAVLWDMTPCSQVNIHQHLEGICCFHFQGRLLSYVIFIVLIPRVWMSKRNVQLFFYMFQYRLLQYKNFHKETPVHSSYRILLQFCSFPINYLLLWQAVVYTFIILQLGTVSTKKCVVFVSELETVMASFIRYRVAYLFFNTATFRYYLFPYL